jgi:hypothetical protein
MSWRCTLQYNQGSLYLYVQLLLHLLLQHCYRTFTALLCTFTAISPHSCRIFTALVPHFYRTFTALLPYFYRTFTALLPHLYRTFTALLQGCFSSGPWEKTSYRGVRVFDKIV